MPHCRLWSDSDWRFAFDTALIAAQLVEGNNSLAGELRLRENKLGTTVDARMALRIRYVDPPEEATPAGVTRLADYRDL